MREKNKIYAHEGWTFIAEISTDSDQWEKIAQLITAAPSLYNGARKVIDRWGDGDLAGAVRELERVVMNIEL